MEVKGVEHPDRGPLGRRRQGPRSGMDNPCRLWRRGHAGRVTPLLWQLPPRTRKSSRAVLRTAGWFSKAGGYGLTTWGCKPSTELSEPAGQCPKKLP